MHHTTTKQLNVEQPSMKRFFSKPGVKSLPNPAAPAPHTPGLQPKDIVPPIPHPYPWELIAVLVSNDGLLLKPHLSESHVASSYVQIPWGKSGKPEEVSGDSSGLYDWNEAIIVYGIVGILELFSGELYSFCSCWVLIYGSSILPLGYHCEGGRWES